eukprot:868506_1
MTQQSSTSIPTANQTHVSMQTSLNSQMYQHTDNAANIVYPTYNPIINGPAIIGAPHQYSITPQTRPIIKFFERFQVNTAFLLLLNPSNGSRELIVTPPQPIVSAPNPLETHSTGGCSSTTSATSQLNSYFPPDPLKNPENSLQLTKINRQDLISRLSDPMLQRLPECIRVLMYKHLSRYTNNPNEDLMNVALDELAQILPKSLTMTDNNHEYQWDDVIAIAWQSHRLFHPNVTTPTVANLIKKIIEHWCNAFWVNHPNQSAMKTRPLEEKVVIK